MINIAHEITHVVAFLRNKIKRKSQLLEIAKDRVRSH